MPARSPLWLSCCTLAALPALLLGDAVLHREVTPDDRLPFMDIHVKRMTEPVNAGLTRSGFVLRRDAAGATPEKWPT